MPNTIGGNGTLAVPVAHVREAGDPCMQGVTRAELEAATDHPAITEFKGMIMSTDALWEL